MKIPVEIPRNPSRLNRKLTYKNDLLKFENFATINNLLKYVCKLNFTTKAKAVRLAIVCVSLSSKYKCMICSDSHSCCLTIESYKQNLRFCNLSNYRDAWSCCWGNVLSLNFLTYIYLQEHGNEPGFEVSMGTQSSTRKSMTHWITSYPIVMFYTIYRF